MTIKPKAPVVLIVEDDLSIQSLLGSLLKREGFSVISAGSAREAMVASLNDSIDLVLLDLELPDEDGLVVARQISSRRDTSIIFLTQRSSSSDKIAGLELGGDDYVTKPFDPEELLARIRSVLRRRRGTKPGVVGEVVSAGGFEIDLARRLVLDKEGRDCGLTRSEFNILLSLANASGRVLSRAQLLDSLADTEEASDRKIDVVISRLRRKVDQPGRPLITTVTGYGYRLNTA